MKRGLKPNAKVFDELIFDVNTAYFEENGGYEFARDFYAEAYRLAVKEIGSEDYILSAVLHADERNKALSEELGRDVYHYHLHVVYVPVVSKEIYFKKNHKDPNLAGTLKDVINQISHSKKWPMRMQAERDGKTVTLNSYSLLQDRFYEHMREAGFGGFERGERGSVKEHLEDLDYKIQQDKKRLVDTRNSIDLQEQNLDDLNKKLAQKKKQIAANDKKLAIQKKSEADISLIDTFGNERTITGKIIVSQEEAKKIKNLANEGVASRGEIHELMFKLNRSNNDCDRAERELEEWKKRFYNLQKSTKPFLEAVRHAPLAAKEMIKEIMGKPSEKQPEQALTAQVKRNRSTEVEL